MQRQMKFEKYRSIQKNPSIMYSLEGDVIHTNYYSVVQVNIKHVIIKKQRKTKDNFLNNPNRKDEIVLEMEESQPKYIKNTSVMKELKQRMEKRPYWIFAIYFILDIFLILGIQYGPNFGIPAKATFWIIMSIAVVITVAFLQSTKTNEPRENALLQQPPRGEQKYLSTVSFWPEAKVRFM